MMKTEDGAELCFPQLLNISCKKQKLCWSELGFLNILLSFISLLSVVLNLLVIISVSHFRQLHTPTNILLLSLAVSDFLVGLLLLPAEILQKTACWILGDLMCSLYYYMIYIITSASIGVMVLISVDRYVAICHPLHYSTRVTQKKSSVLCLSVLALLFFLQHCCFKDDLIQPGRHRSCYGDCRIIVNYIAGVTDLVLTFIVPITAIIVLYMKVFIAAVSQAHAMLSNIAALKIQHSVSLKKKSELKAARTLGVLVLVFLICFCPYYYVTFAGENVVSAASVSFVVFLFYFNSCLNPMIYDLCYPWFRKTVKLIVTLQILQPGSVKLT